MWPLSFFIIFATSFSHASDIRLVGSFGFGNSGAENEGVVKTEDPLAIGLSAEYSMSSRFTLGIEHNRSFKSAKSNIGVTGVVSRWYLWTPHAQFLQNSSDKIEKTQILHKGYMPYLGFAAGFGQSSLPRQSDAGRDVSVTKAYISGKAGIESSLFGPWGWRTEFSWAEGVAGDGSLRMMHLFFGFYYFL